MRVRQAGGDDVKDVIIFGAFWWSMLGFLLTILSAIALAKLLTMGEVGLRDDVRRRLAPLRRAMAERRKMRRALRQLETCERRYKGVNLG